MPHFSNASPIYAPSSVSSPYRTPFPLSVNPTPPGQSPSSASPFSEASFTPDGLTLPGLQVPQKLYRPHTASDQRRYVDEVQLDPPILFYRQGPPQIGMPLLDATTSRFIRLVGRDDPLFENRGPSISVRLVWEGYQPWSRQIPTRDFKTPPGPITRSKLAKNVAKTIERFISEHQERDMEAGADRRWQVGPGKIEMKDLLLVSMHHVSMGSWQANVCLNRPLPSFGLESPH
ncbi:hypothetical protein DFH11DRAFT_1506227 [Phellopilus nigrolimitatus]|nr:hypothetical protein DFH11DRAFT_1506227 [Phellopilus nigrolimitatus]